MTQRTDSRSPRNLTVLLADRLPALCADVGPGGLCMQMPGVFVPGAKVHGSVVVGRKHIPFLGEVAWARPGDLKRRSLSRVGIRFVEPSPELSAVLAAGAPRPSGKAERIMIRRPRPA